MRLQEIEEEIQVAEIRHRTAGSFSFSQFCLYPSERQLFCSDRAVQISPKTFDALVLLAARAEHLVRKAELMDALWPGIYVSEANLTNIIVELRKLLGQDAIHTVAKHGYRFMLPVESAPELKQAAHGAFTQAKELIAKPSIKSMLRARDLLWLSIAEDSGSAAAWAWLGHCCCYLEKCASDSTGNFDLAKAAFRQAFTLDPGLAAAHFLYAPLEADLGHSREAMSRLLRRLANGSREPQVFTSLVQVLRYCGLPNESILAHEHAVASSISQTYFLCGQYKAAIETHAQTDLYLDAAAWAVLGDKKQAMLLLEERTLNPHLPPVLRGLINSLLAMLHGRSSQAIDELVKTPIQSEPELVFYFARHFSKLKAAGLAMEALQRAQAEGFVCSRALRDDPWFAVVRFTRDFPALLQDALKSEEQARATFEHLGGASLLI